MSLETNLGSLYRKTMERFRQGGIENPGLEASVIVCSVLGKPSGAVHTSPQITVGRKQVSECENRTSRRLKGEPCAYATGEREFFSRRFAVSPAVLIPRPETETVVEVALEKIPQDIQMRAIDVGTGSGCIAVTLKKEKPLLSVTAVDISPHALKKAEENARFHGADISFVCGDTLRNFEDNSADIIVSNPPYVSEEEFETLPDEIRIFEPKKALVSGEGGFEHIRKIVADAARVLRAGGWCVVEVGDGQAPGCVEIFEKNGFSGISTTNDISGKPRAVEGIWKR
ncbi:MAG: peptide chain release factor N(5)-glutamine methyltransferase [Candidatus Mycalebacterium zealandia]|nr:MAG: peptide chain release factor N(5)-glutamine methyltransferase [Candidatus Mycalebacterium zealandia]